MYSRGYTEVTDYDPVLDKLEAWQAAIVAYGDGPPPPTGLPNHRLSVHWIADQVRQCDKDYMAQLRPAVVKIVNPSPDRVAEAFQWIDPAGHVALRYHPISEQQAELAADPAGLGRKHADYWIAQLAGPYARFDRNRLYVMGINEPSVHNAAEATRVAVYTEQFLRTLQPHGIRAYVFNFSVGWPREENGRIIWDEFLHLEPLINACNSFGCVHEYGYPSLLSGWNSYGNRVSRCPLKIKFVIGECGYTRQLASLPQPWGWQGNLSAAEYAAMLWEYSDRVDPNKVFAVCPFTTSYGGAEWASKDTAPAHNEIVARRRPFTWPAGWPVYGGEAPPESDPMLIIFPKFTGKITGLYGTLYQNSAGATYAHEGMDISMPVGTQLVAPADGIVAYSGTDAAYGEYTRLYSPQLRTCFFFAHLSERRVQGGNSVKQGQIIGLSGNTGNSTGPHLHFECRQMTETGSYKVYLPNQPLCRQNGRIDPLGWLGGWLAAGNRVEER